MICVSSVPPLTSRMPEKIPKGKSGETFADILEKRIKELRRDGRESKGKV